MFLSCFLWTSLYLVFHFFAVFDYPKTKNPFGSDNEDDEAPVPLRRTNKQTSMSLADLTYNSPLRSKSVSTISVNTLGGRRRSRKSYRAPDPPKGVRPYSLIMETSAEKTA